MKKLNINYLVYNPLRQNYYKLMFYFLNKIKNENKEKIQLHIATQKGEESLWENRKNELVGIDCIVRGYDRVNHNYLHKIQYGSNLDIEYSVKLDDDIFINNYIWDYMIENLDSLNEEDIIMTSMLSNNMPCVDYFIEGIFDDENKKKMYDIFLNMSFPDGLWSVNYGILNKHTINTDKWDLESFNNSLYEMNTDVKGMHPNRISWQSHLLMNNFILENIDVIIEKNEYDILKKKVPYFTNSFFIMKTKLWKDIIDNHRGSDIYDEIGINKYMRNNNKNLLVINNSYSVHCMYNTVHGNKNKWNIGFPEGINDEIKFTHNLMQKII
jgi:hypothetical protein